MDMNDNEKDPGTNSQHSQEDNEEIKGKNLEHPREHS